MSIGSAVLGLLAPTGAVAGDLVVKPAQDQSVVVLVDGDLRGEAPVQIRDLDAGDHHLAFKGTPFGAVVFEENVSVPETGEVGVIVDLAARSASVVSAMPPAVGDTTDAPEEATPAPEAPADEAEATTTPQPVGDLYVAADVEGAAILIDGQDTGSKTPAMISGIAPGRHKVRVVTECARATAEVEVRKDLIDRAELVLEEGTGVLRVTSVPEGATVLLDGSRVGDTPYEAAGLTCGDHALELRAPGHLSTTRSIRVPAFEITHLDVALDEERFGTLVVAPDPLQSRLSLDSEEVGTGPMTLEAVGAGTHELAVALDGYATDVRSVEVAPDEVTRVEVTLEPAKQRAGSGRPWGRIAANSAVTAAGIGVGTWAVATYGRAKASYQDFLDVPSDATARQIYDEEVRPARTAALTEGAVAVVLLGASGWLWATTDFAVAAGPGGVAVQGRW